MDLTGKQVKKWYRYNEQFRNKSIWFVWYKGLEAIQKKKKDSLI